VYKTKHKYYIYMSAPSIPNLLSPRGASRGGDRGRGRSRGRGFGMSAGGGRGRGGPGSEPGSASAARLGHDATVQGTDTDAAVSRLSAVELGYLQDPFANLFVQAAPPGPSARRLPIINRGKLIPLVGIPFSQTKTIARDIHKNHGDRQARGYFPLPDPGSGKANHITRCWHRHTQLEALLTVNHRPTTAGPKSHLS